MEGGGAGGLLYIRIQFPFMYIYYLYYMNIIELKIHNAKRLKWCGKIAPKWGGMCKV
jgi:hypothetical protein